MIDGWTDGKIGVWMDGWTDEWIDALWMTLNVPL